MTKLPEVIILSTQRSGTHLLLSFLAKHPKINGMGEIFYRYKKNGILKSIVPDMINVGILMYSEVSTYKLLGGNFRNVRLIHLIRDPLQIAVSRIQMQADKIALGDQYQAHYHENESDKFKTLVFNKRIKPDLTQIDKIAKTIAHAQHSYVELLKDTEHLEINYADLTRNNEQVKRLEPAVQSRLLEFIGLYDDADLFTTYIKTGSFEVDKNIP